LFGYFLIGQSKYLKIAKDTKSLFGEPCRARRAHFPVQGGAKRRRNDRAKRRKFDIGAFIQPNPNLLWKKLTDCRACGAAGTPPKTAGGQKFLSLKPLLFCPPAFARFAGEPPIFIRQMPLSQPAHTRAFEIFTPLFLLTRLN